MGEKSAGTGLFHIPTAPAALTAVTQSGSANTYGSAASFGTAPSTLYIVAVNIGVASLQIPTYVAVQILVAASVVGEVLIGWGAGTGATGQVISARGTVWPPIPVASGAAITVKTASSVASGVAWGVSLECIAQSNVVDDGVVETTNVTQVNAHAVTDTASGVLDVNAKNLGGTAQTGRDVGASVLLSSGAGAGQLDFTSGVVKANLTQILATALTETAGLLAGGFKKFFNVASPTGTLNSIPDAVAGAAGGLFIAGTNAATSVTTALTANITGNLSGSVGSVTARVTANTDQLAGQTVTAAAGVTFPTSVASPTNITAGVITTATNLTNAPTNGDFTAAMKTSLNAATPVVTVSDKTGFSLSAAGIQAIWDALTSALTTAGSVGKLLVDNLNATITSRMASYTQPTGFLAATFPSGTVANTTNITAGTMTTTTNLTTNNDKTGYGLSAAAVQAIWDALTSALTTVGSIGKRIADNLDAAITTRTKPADTQARVTLVDTVTTYTGNTPQTGDAYARLGAPAGASVSEDVAIVEANLENVQGRIPVALIEGHLDAITPAEAMVLP